MCNPKIHYRFQNSPPLVLILSQISLLHAFSSCVLKIHFSITCRFDFFWVRAMTEAVSLRPLTAEARVRCQVIACRIFFVDRVALRQVCLPVIPQLLHIHSFLSFFNGSTAPWGPRPPHCRGFTITLRHSVGLLWTSDQLVAETSI